MKKSVIIASGILIILIAALVMGTIMYVPARNKAQVGSLDLTIESLTQEINRLRNEIVKLLSSSFGGMIIDNSDLANVRTGIWTKTTTTKGYIGSEYEYFYGQNGSFTFKINTPLSGLYDVSAYWTAGRNRSSIVPIDVITDGSVRATKIVNQQTSGATWVSLGSYNMTVGGDNRVVIKTAGSNGYIIADAVKLTLKSIATTTPVTPTPAPTPTPTPEPTPTPVPTPLADVVVDNTQTLSTSGSWTSSSYVTGFYGTNYLYGLSSNGSLSATFTGTLPTTGTYKVYTHWTGAWAERDRRVPYVVTHKLGNTTVYVDQTADGSAWKLLGTFSFNSGATGIVTVKTTGTTGDVIVDAVRFEQVDSGTPLTPPDPVVSTYTLSVTKSGTGAGTVTGTGINCGTDCSETVNSGTSITLTTTPASGSTFSGWSGACSGTGSCSVSMTAARSVAAAFTLVPAAPTPTPSPTNIGPYMDNSTLPSGAIIVTPGQSIQSVIDNAPSGSTIAVRAGTYNGKLTIRKTIVLRNYPGERPIINGGVWSDEKATIVFPDDDGISAKNSHISGLEITGGYYAIKIDGGEYHPGLNDGIVIENNIVHDVGFDGIKVTYNGKNIIVRNNEVYRTGRGGGNAQGIDSVGNDYIKIQNNYVHDTVSDGIFTKGGSANAIIENNKVINTGTGGEGNGIMTGNSGTDNYVFNLSVNPGMKECVNCIVRNNYIDGVANYGIAINGADGTKLENNTILNARGAGVIIQAVENWPVTGGYLSIPSSNVTMTANKIKGTSNSIVIKNNPMGTGITGTFTGSSNTYYNPSGSAAFRDDTKSFNGGLTAWKQIRTDTGSVEQAF